MNEKDIARFWAKIDRRGPDDCWEWTAGNRGKGGYGRFSMGRANKPIRAHRFSWELFYGPIPTGMDVLHRCDNPLCVNPRHLFLGTNLDNVRDMHAKNRHSHGEGHGQAKLTDAKVRKIRELRKLPGNSYERLAKRFRVSVICIWKVCVGETWKHVV